MTHALGRTMRGLLALSLVVPALALVAAGLDAPPAGATFPGVNGRIAYSEGADLWSRAADGSDPVQLTDPSSGADTNPRWSPDGTKIAFDSTRTGSPEVWVMDADGSDEVQLTSTTAPVDDRAPTWSPDGTKLAFLSDRDSADNFFRAWVMDADGTDAALLTSAVVAVESLDWSPDGTKLLAQLTADVGTIDSSTATPTDPFVNLTNTGNPFTERHPSWSPDGTKFTYATDVDGGLDEIYVANADGSSPTRLTTNTAVDAAPSWSPDGTTILFTTSSPGGVQSVPAAGGAPVDLDGAATAQSTPDQQPLASSLTIVLDTLPDRAQDFHFDATGAGVTAFDLDDDPVDGTLASSKTFDLTAGSYAVTQTAVAGFPLFDLVCDTGESVSPSTGVATITLIAGEHTTCTYTNRQNGTLTVVQNSVPNDAADFQFSTIRFGPSADLDDDADPTLPNSATFEFAPGPVPLVQQTVIPGLPLASIVCSEPAAIDLTVRSAGVTIDGGDAVTCTFTNARPRPDARIAAAAAGPYVGNNVYNPRRDALQPQAIARNVAKGRSVTFFVRIENDAAGPGQFKILGNGDTSAFTIKYFKGLAGAVSITSQVKAGTFTFGAMTPGVVRYLRVQVTAKATTPKGFVRDAVVTATSTIDPTKKDTVRGRARVV